jgi:hypothetical protein
MWLLKRPEGTKGRRWAIRKSACRRGREERFVCGVAREIMPLGLALVERRGSGNLCASVIAWYDAAFNDSDVEMKAGEWLARDGVRQDAVVRCSKDEVRLGIGPDTDTARAIVR